MSRVPFDPSLFKSNEMGFIDNVRLVEPEPRFEKVMIMKGRSIGMTNVTEANMRAYYEGRRLMTSPKYLAASIANAIEGMK